MGDAAAATRAALVAGVVAATGDAPAPDGAPGPSRPRDACCPVFDCEPLASRLQNAGRGMALCTELGDVSELHAAARCALTSCPPCDPAGLNESFIFTDGSASPPARPDACARLGWSAVCVGRCGTGYHFLGSLFHGITGSGDVVQNDPVGDSNAMELAAVLWALVWVVISCPPCSPCIATGSMFSCNVVGAIWSVGGHAQLACLCSSLLLVARQVAEVRFQHVKAHEGNPFNELADGLALRAAGGFVAPLPGDVARLLVCSNSVAWEWMHGMPPEARGSYPPVQDGSFVFREVRSTVDPVSLIKNDATDAGGDVAGAGGCCSMDVMACVMFASINVCTLGDSGRRSRFLAGRPALIRSQVRELGINLLGVQGARSPPGARVVGLHCSGLWF